MGKADTNLVGIDVVAMRDGPQITNEHRELLIAPITEEEILRALKNIGDLKAPGMDGSIVNHSQAAFVPGQHIHDHILLAYELIRGYSRKGGTPKCMLQLDLQKAYDTVDWHALQHILREVGLPNQFIRWIMLG
ncbi:ribonuclease H protein, partial [Trifolium medium]|nr:ribonuclease H protein [Trifolium medium]